MGKIEDIVKQYESKAEEVGKLSSISRKESKQTKKKVADYSAAFFSLFL
jgi:hypothetical protein